MTATAAIFAPRGEKLTGVERQFFRDVDPWGFILFARNIGDAAQLRALCEDLRATVGRDAAILIDQEGGRVQRILPPLARRWRPPLTDVARLGARAPEGMYLRARIMAEELRGFGIDVNCIPTLDVAGEGTHEFLRNRCYGETPDQVTDVGRAVVRGLLDGGVLPVMKHIPGHGRGRVDSHLELPHTRASVHELRAVDWVPFAALSDVPMGMTAHMIFEAVDPHFPATQSGAMINLIREEIGFAGLLMTDDISMQALSGTPGDRAKAAIAAGCDLVLHCNGYLDEMRDVADNAGPMSEGAMLRGRAALALRQPAGEVDTEALDAQFEALLARR
ncbi:MAG: glycoside hydrolase family 3 N-terminal domain-containing protein [Marinovum algicola]|uniref:beta-N-acetylhexosaminidase n=1 Tax=Marinovum algicola TaxID=42444 RepID=A0A975ZMP5_9RHOB|nr:glycoside hydrolase family 3 N-terminal domain-containing protein [Marinovum algicola]SEJ11875.1 beta-N-acetylhexosaminidase [Marinovum algicola]SLN21223.1 Beta-hexosaminidase [Marinovum algicola]